MCVARPDGPRAHRESTQIADGRQQEWRLAFKLPEASVFSFDQVINENHASARRSKSRKGLHSRSGLSPATSRDSRRWAEPNQQPGFYHHSLVRSLLLKTLMQGQASATQGSSPANFCYVQVNTSPGEPAGSKGTSAPASATRSKAHRFFGRFLSLRGLEDGTNVAFLAIKDLLTHRLGQLAQEEPHGA